MYTISDTATESPNSIVEAVRAVIGKYADFHGRAGRPEFWWWQVAQLAAVVAVVVVGQLTIVLGGLLDLTLIIGGFVPGLAVLTRRLHDTGRSGVFMLVSLIPFVGMIILIVVTALPSEPRTNRYDLLTQLRRLMLLRDRGVLSSGEFEGRTLALLHQYA